MINDWDQFMGFRIVFYYTYVCNKIYLYIYLLRRGLGYKKKPKKNTSLAREKGRVENDSFFFFLECVIYISNKISSKISDLS